jgi:anthranilate phosphoribosyltransferase
MLRRFISRIVEGENLTENEAYQAMATLMEGEATTAQIGAFLTGLRMKGETVEEITGFARSMREKSVRIQPRSNGGCDGGWVVDTCGTGGDGRGTFNISTAVALVAAGGGLTVAKHGNRSVSSQCGSADALEALGVNINLPPERAADCLEEIGLAFLFAPLFHPAMKHALTPRREIGIRTVFNRLGPLTNPAGASAQVVGLYRADLLQPIAEVLKNLGCRGALVVHGDDRCDEISISGRTFISHLSKGEISNYEIQPEDFGLRRGTLEEIRGGTAKDNARIILDVLQGVAGPPREVVLLNGAAVFVAAEKVSGLREGIEMAKESIDSGKAMEKLKELIRFSNREGQECS